jgi:hypothetical protein
MSSIPCGENSRQRRRQNGQVTGGARIDGLSHHQELVPHAQSAGEVVDGEAAVQPGQAMNHGRIEMPCRKCAAAPP